MWSSGQRILEPMANEGLITGNRRRIPAAILVGDLEREAIRLMARFEGIVLDPVYAGRAFGAFVDLIRKGVFKRDETVLFWHTGGAPALFAYANELL